MHTRFRPSPSARTRAAVGLAVALTLGSTSLRAQSDAIPRRAFQEARWLATGEAIWSRPLCEGPLVFASPVTREFVANRPGLGGRERDSVWSGTLARTEIGVANTAFTLDGTRWTMMMLPLPSPAAIRTALLAHECWHALQREIGLEAPRSAPSTPHLDEATGRTWLFLEWRALARALLADDTSAARPFVGEALAFRRERQRRYPGSAAAEARWEMHEGLAEYTGVRLMGLGDWSRRAYLAARLVGPGPARGGLAASFAYESGPALGLLLDRARPAWRTALTTQTDLAALLDSAYGLPRPRDALAVVAQRHGFTEIDRAERRRATAAAAQRAAYRAQLVSGPTLALPTPSGNYSYDPNALLDLGPDGVVFPTSRISDWWGVLTVTGGVRLSLRRDTAYVAMPVSLDARSHATWTLALDSSAVLVRQGQGAVARKR